MPALPANPTAATTSASDVEALVSRGLWVAMQEHAAQWIETPFDQLVLDAIQTAKGRVGPDDVAQTAVEILKQWTTA